MEQGFQPDGQVDDVIQFAEGVNQQVVVLFGFHFFCCQWFFLESVQIFCLMEQLRGIAVFVFAFYLCDDDHDAVQTNGYGFHHQRCVFCDEIAFFHSLFHDVTEQLLCFFAGADEVFQLDVPLCQIGFCQRQFQLCVAYTFYFHIYHVL